MPNFRYILNLGVQDAMWLLKVDDDFQDDVLSDVENLDDYD